MALTPPTGGQAAPTAVAPVAPPNTYAALYTLGPTGATGATGPQGPIGPGNATSPTILTANNAAEIPLTIKGAASQSANLLELRDSTNALLANLVAGGGLMVAGTTSVSGSFVSTPTYYGGGGVPAVLKGQAADGASAVGSVLDTTVNLVTAGAKLLSVRNNASEKFYVDKDGIIANSWLKIDANGLASLDNTRSLKLSGTGSILNASLTDGASAVAHSLDCTPVLSTAGAKLLSVRNAGVEKAFFDLNGNLALGAWLTTQDTGGGNGRFIAAQAGSFDVNSYFQFRNSSGSKTFYRFGSGEPIAIKGDIADGASAVNTIVDTFVTYATSGAKLLSVRNNTAEKSYVDKDGGIYSVASGGLKTGTSSGIRLQTCDEVLLADGPNVPFANSYAASYNGDGTITSETWTDSGSSRLRRRLDYGYANALVSTIRTRVYSADDGTTVVGDMTETLTYSSGRLASSSITRSV